MERDELWIESEEEFDTHQALRKEYLNIKDFEDIGHMEKEMFLLWNNFIREIKYPRLNFYKKYPEYPAPTVSDFGTYLNKFVERHKPQLLGLRVPFVLHLNALLCFGFIDKFEMLLILTELH
jgi:hypothetical protein